MALALSIYHLRAVSWSDTSAKSSSLPSTEPQYLVEDDLSAKCSNMIASGTVMITCRLREGFPIRFAASAHAKSSSATPPSEPSHSSSWSCHDSFVAECPLGATDMVRPRFPSLASMKRNASKSHCSLPFSSVKLTCGAKRSAFQTCGSR